MSEPVYSVTQLNGLVKSLLDGDSRLQRVTVRGELSNYKIYPSGHHYFTVKDEGATLKAVMFRGEASHLRFRPESGMKVLVSGRITVYPRDGAYQLYATDLIPDGVGDLAVAFEQLKDKLDREGLFAPAHKKALPAFPRRIAVITSSAGAAVRDVIRVATSRYPLCTLLVMGVRVQGTEAPAEIAAAIRYANQHRVADLIITGRGGGSLEDLWAFNDERVARAIYASEIPVISAVGHEPDVTISDFVADLRAATPSNAAELAVPDRAELLNALSAMQKRMSAAVSARLSGQRAQLRKLRERRVLTDPGTYVADRRLSLDHADVRLRNAAQALARRKEGELKRLCAALDAMSPLKVLARGYAIAETEGGNILRSAGEVRDGERLLLRLSDGALVCRAEVPREEGGTHG